MAIYDRFSLTLGSVQDMVDFVISSYGIPSLGYGGDTYGLRYTCEVVPGAYSCKAFYGFSDNRIIITAKTDVTRYDNLSDDAFDTYTVKFELSDYDGGSGSVLIDGDKIDFDYNMFFELIESVENVSDYGNLVRFFNLDE